MAKFKNLGKVGGAAARKAGARSRLGQAGDVTIDGVQTAAALNSPPRTDTMGKAFDTLGSVGGIGFMAAGFGPSVVLGGSSGALHYAGKGANKVGGLFGKHDLGQGLQNTGERITNFRNSTVEKELGETVMGSNFAGAVDSALSPIYALTSKLDGMTGLFSNGAKKHQYKASLHGEKAAAHANEALHALSPDMATHVKDLLGAASANDVAAFTAHSDALKALQNTAKLEKPVAGLLGKVEKFASKQMAALGSAATATSFATGKHDTANKIKGATNSSAVAHTALFVGSVGETAATVKDTLSDVDAFRSMIADIKGVEKDQVDSGDTLFSELPYAGQVARKALLISAPPRAILEAINQTFNVRMIAGKHDNMMLFMLPMFASQAIGMFTSGNILDEYKTMKSNEQNGVPSEAEDYAKLIGLANKQLHARLGSESSFAKEVGRIYAERHVSLKQTLADAQNGVIDQLIYHIQHENVGQQASAQAAQQPETPSTELAQVDEVHANAAHMVHEKPANDATAPQERPENFAARVAQQPTSFTKGVS